MIEFGTFDIWEPRLAPTDGDFEKKKAAANGALLWLYRNAIVSGEFREFGSGDIVAIMKAQLSARGYQIANRSDRTSDGATLGQVAIEAMADPSSRAGQVGIELVARRFTES